MVDEIRLHGRGGQGVVAAGELIAISAVYEGKFCRAFPMYGSARRGAPVVAFAQIGEESEATRSMIYHPKYLILLDPEIVEVTNGLRDDGVILYNTKKSVAEARGLFDRRFSQLSVVDANGIAERFLGRPIPNTAMLGAFSKATGILNLESVNKAIRERFTGRLVEANVGAAKAGYDEVQTLNLR
jgi:pyruvate ferredoxin oxidoreductase gamma subunit